MMYQFISRYQFPSLIGICSLALPFLYYKYIRNIKQNRSPVDVVEVLFFSDKNALCYDHISNEISCKHDCGYQKLNKLLEFINSAKESIDLCVFVIGSDKLGEAIIDKFNHGVKVRVITDDSKSFEEGSQITLFRKNGIRVRAPESKCLMHHKFAIIDGRILIHGSLNWTQQALLGNWENVTITSQPEKLIRSFDDYFEKFWQILE